MNDINPNAKPSLWFFLLLLLAVAMLLFLIPGCEVIKGKKTVHSDSTAVSAKDAGAVKTSFDSSKKENQWTKETFVFPPAVRDCTVNNNYFPQPTVYIRESGSSKEQTAIGGYDSTWQKRYDSLNAVKNTTEKTKETTILSPWQIIAISIGGCAFLYIILKLAVSYISKFTIVKKLQT